MAKRLAKLRALKGDTQFGPAHLLLSSRLAPEHRAKMDLAERVALTDKVLGPLKDNGRAGLTNHPAILQARVCHVRIWIHTAARR